MSAITADVAKLTKVATRVVATNQRVTASTRMERKNRMKKKEVAKAYPWVHPAFEVRSKSCGGHGLYSTKFIPSGTLVWEEIGEAQTWLWHTVDEVETWSKEEREDWEIHNFQVDENTFSGDRVKAGTPLSERNRDDFTNHSCDPTIWLVTDAKMIARRDINIDDEITYDYCTTESENSRHVAQKWKCNCGAKDCRGGLTGKEYADPILQKKYEGHWSDYLQLRIEAMEKEKEKEIATE